MTVSLISIQLFSQNVEWKKENFPGREELFKESFKRLEKADQLYNQGPPFYQAALVEYLGANEFNPNNDMTNFHIGHIYYALHKPHEAENYYEKAIKLNPSLKEYILYELATAYHQDMNWDEAISHYQDYKKFLKEGGHKHVNMHEKDVNRELRYIDLCIKQCETGKVLTHDTIPVKYLNLGGAINSEYPDYTPVINHDENLLIFASKRPGSTGSKINTSAAFDFDDVYFSVRNENGWGMAQKLYGSVNKSGHEAPVWVSGNGTRLLVYIPGKGKYDRQGNIYESDFVDGAWTKAAPLKMVNSKYRETHASISNDGKTIYFTTNNPKWAKHGGLDIVKTTYNEATGKWSEPVDVGGNVNTEWDEESPFIKPDNKTFYFSSQGHTSIGGFDFFKAEIDEKGNIGHVENLGFPLNTAFDDVFIYFSDDGKRAYFNSDREGGLGSNDIYEVFILNEIKLPFQLTLLDAVTKQPINNADVKIHKLEEKIYLDVENKKNGTYTSDVKLKKTFEVTVSSDKYKTQIFTFTTSNIDLNSNFDTVVIRKTLLMEEDKEPIAFKGVIYDKISGKPIEGLLEVTTMIDGKNVKVADIKSDANGIFSKDLPKNTTYEVTVLARGRMPFREDVQLTNNTSEKKYYLDKIKVGDRFSMRNIQYDYAKSTLKKESITELMILLEFMTENPDIHIEVSAHTDITGSRAGNIKLSNARAKSVYDWLIKNGIDSARIKYKGYGPDMPIATNDTDEGRALNRRSEIKIIE